MPSTFFAQPTEWQAIPVHSPGTVLSLAVSDSKFRLKKEQGPVGSSPRSCFAECALTNPANGCAQRHWRGAVAPRGGFGQASSGRVGVRRRIALGGTWGGGPPLLAPPRRR